MKAKILILVIAIVAIMSPLSFTESYSSTDSEYDGCCCTGYYVGSAVSADGTVMLGQTADYGPYFGSLYYRSYDAVDNVAGRTITALNGHVFEFPASTYKYIVYNVSYNDKLDASMGTGAVNSEGVAYTGSITGYPSDKAIEADPYVEKGLHEDTSGEIVASCCKTAREGVELLASIIDKDGCSEGAMFIIGDSEETWYMECYTGHQYMAIKLPENVMLVTGNEYGIRSLDEGLDRIVSDGLASLPVEKGFAVYDEEGNLDVKKTYAEANDVLCHMRGWIAHRIFDSVDVGDYKEEVEYPLYFVPKEKVSLKQLMDFTKNRYEGTEFCPEDHDVRVRVVATEMMHEAHILQVYKDLPKEMNTVFWSCVSTSEFGVYVPFSNCVTAFSKEYGTLGNTTDIDESTAKGIFKLLNSFCGMKRSILKEAVMGYWSAIDDYYIEVYPKVLKNMCDLYKESPSKAFEYATTYAISVQEDTYKDAVRVYNDCRFHMVSTADTYKKPVVMTTMIDAKEFSKRYGWTSTFENGILTLTNGKSVVTVKDITADFKTKCIVSVDGVESKENLRICEGSYCIPMKYASIFAQDEAVIVYHEHQTKDSGNNTVLVVCAVLAAIIVIGGVSAYIIHRKNNM